MTEKRRKDDCRDTNVTFSLDTGHVKIYIKYVYIVSSSVHSLVSPSPSEFIIVAIIVILLPAKKIWEMYWCLAKIE